MFFKSPIFRFFLHVIFLIGNRHRSASRITDSKSHERKEFIRRNFANASSTLRSIVRK